MEFISKKLNQYFIVWLKESNRYVIFHKPGFEIFKRLNKKLSVSEVSEWFLHKYKVEEKDAKIVVADIAENLSQLKILGQNKSSENKNCNIINLISSKNFQTYSYQIFNQFIQFSYSSQWMQDMIHPGIVSCQISDLPEKPFQFHLIEERKELLLIAKKTDVSSWKIYESEYFKGSVSLQLLNALYNKTDESWMGTFHAAAVSKHNNAVLISAASGKGKSTLSALLAASGLQLISDDLVPISLDNQEIYSLPLSISVKPGAVKVLQPFYPELETAEIQYNSSTGKEVFYINPKIPAQKNTAKVNAIIFPEYDAATDFEWKQVDHISVMDNFLSESWIANNEKAAQTFLDWFFEIPCYRLKYSNNKKAIEKIKSLLK